MRRIVKALVVCSLLVSGGYAENYTDGFDYPMVGASDYINGLGYNTQYSGYYTDVNTINITKNNKPHICEEGGNNAVGCIFPKGTWKNTNDVGNYYSNYNLLHSGEDWNKVDNTYEVGTEVKAIANGIIYKVTELFGKDGYQVVIKHTASQGNTFIYPKNDPTVMGFNFIDIGNTVYSVYLHITNIGLKKGDNITKGETIGKIASLENSKYDTPPHLHLELKDGRIYPQEITDELLKIYPKTKGYYESFEALKAHGILDPSDFIKANYKPTPREKLLEIGTIKNIKKCNKVEEYGIDGELKLEWKGKGNLHCIELIGDDANFTESSIVWWRVKDSSPFTSIEKEKIKFSSKNKLQVKFDDGKDKGEATPDDWEMIVTNEYDTIDKTKRSDFTGIHKSNPVKFKVLQYSEIPTRPKSILTAIKECDTNNIKPISRRSSNFELLPKKEKQCIELFGSNITKNSIIWLNKKGGQKNLKQISANLTDTSIKFYFNDEKSSTQTKADVWEIYVTNDNQKPSENEASVTFKVLPYSQNETPYTCPNPIPFTDIANSKYKNAICYLASKNILDVSKEQYHPDVPINRVAFLKIILFSELSIHNTLTSDEDETKKLLGDEIIPKKYFLDIPKKSDVWYKKYVYYAKERKVGNENKPIIDGYPDNTFKPNNPINFAEVSKIVKNIFFSDDKDTDVPNYREFCQEKVTPSSWFDSYIYILDKNDIPVFCPNKEITRAEMAEIIYQTLKHRGE